MNRELLKKLKELTPEEKMILQGEKDIDRQLYISPGTVESAPVGEGFIVDSSRLMEKGRLIEIRPHTRFAHFPPHTHNYVELVYMCSGSTTHILNNRDVIELKAGDILFLNQHAVQEILPAGEDDIAVNFIILPGFFDKVIAMMGSDNVLRSFLINSLAGNNAGVSYLFFRTGDILPVRNLMENMIWNLVERKKQTNIINQTTMGLVLMNLSSFAPGVDRVDSTEYEQQQVYSALKYIEENYKDGTLSELCERLGEKTYYISRILKKHTGCNFKELLQKRKLEQASYLLLNTTLTTTKIMETVGYDNSGYFHKKFREVYGTSPKNYRR